MLSGRCGADFAVGRTAGGAFVPDGMPDRRLFRRGNLQPDVRVRAGFFGKFAFADSVGSGRPAENPGARSAAAGGRFRSVRCIGFGYGLLVRRCAGRKFDRLYDKYRYKARFERKMRFFEKKDGEIFAGSEKVPTFASAFEKQTFLQRS